MSKPLHASAPRSAIGASVLLLLLFLPSLFADGWSDCWPSQEHPREGYRHLSELYTAVVERCYAAGLSNSLPSAPAWYRSNRTVLSGLKSKVSDLIPYYVHRAVLDTNSPYCYTRAASQGSSFTVPMLTVTGVLCALNMPVNYFSYTPYRSISGAGGDIVSGIAYPVGFTNATTAAGGSWFPSGQTNWYTTDYGYAKLPDLLNLLIWTASSAVGETVAAYEAATNDTKGWTQEQFDILKADASTLWALTTGTNVGWKDRAVTDGSFQQIGGWMEARAASQTWRVKAAGLATNCSRQVEFYAYTQTPATYQGFTPVFSAMGEGWSENHYNYVSLSSESSDPIVYSATAGSTNFPSLWLGPYDNGQGYRHTAYKALVLWDVQDGFAYH